MFFYSSMQIRLACENAKPLLSHGSCCSQRPAEQKNKIRISTSAPLETFKRCIDSSAKSFLQTFRTATIKTMRQLRSNIEIFCIWLRPTQGLYQSLRVAFGYADLPAFYQILAAAATATRLTLRRQTLCHTMNCLTHNSSNSRGRQGFDYMKSDKLN